MTEQEQNQRQIREVSDKIAEWLATQDLNQEDPEQIKLWVLGMERVTERLKAQLEPETEKPQTNPPQASKDKSLIK